MIAGIIVLIVIICIIVKQQIKHPHKPKQDVTCEKEYGHDHKEQPDRYIVHDETEQGYVILNGVKRRIEDCKDL